MLRRIFMVIVFLGLGASPVLAAPILSIEGPSTYTPGGTFQCQVLLSGADHLADFSANMALTGPGGIAGTDFYFQDAARPASHYVFDGQTTFGFSHSATGGSVIGLGDSLLSLTAEVSTVAGASDRLATLTIATSPAMTGNLVLDFATSGGHYLLYLDDCTGGPIPGCDTAVSSFQPTTLSSVPEPATLLLLIGGAGSLSLFRRRRTP